VVPRSSPREGERRADVADAVVRGEVYRAEDSRTGDSGADGSRVDVAPALVARCLTRVYGTGDAAVRALNDVSFEVCHGDMVCIMGKSGSGKSTLLRQLGLLDSPTSGQVMLDGVDVTHLREGRRRVLRLNHLGFVFQEYALLPELSAEENVFVPALMAGTSLRSARARAAELLAMLGLHDRAAHRPSELSGGQQQRVAIARAMINDPRVLFADEPTGNLDSEASEMVMVALTRMNRELGVTIVFVSHESDDLRFAQQLIVLRDGAVVAGDRP
jgi:putative ABC transport system ATP-binding protein